MAKPIYVSLSGPAFSFLLYENSKCQVQQEGFLIGEIVRQETKTITDNDQEQVIISKIIKIKSVIPSPQPNYFYNAIGKIDEEIVRSILGSEFNKVVAWYKYHRMSSFKFTFREKVIHRQLYELFGVPSDLFSCCLLISESSDNLSTHMYSQTFVRYGNYGYDRLPMQISNLSEPNNTYITSTPASETFKKLMADIKVDTKKSQGLVVINQIQNALQKHTLTVVDELSEAEGRMRQLEVEVALLTKQLRLKRELEAATSSFSKTESPTKELPVAEGVEMKEPLEKPPEVRLVTPSPRGRGKGRGRKKGTTFTKVEQRDSDTPTGPRLRKKS